jgi:hypothetical protein
VIILKTVGLFSQTLTLLIIGLSVSFEFALAQEKEHRVEGEYSMKFDDNLTKAQARAIVIERAKIQAIKSKLGEVIVQGNATYLRNTSNGVKQESLQSFNMQSETLVNGEWVRDSHEPKVTFENHTNTQSQLEEMWIKAKVSGIIRELPPNIVQFQSRSLNCPKRECQTDVFNHNQQYYLSFTSPVNGYLCVYMDIPEENKTYRLLPYKYLTSENAVFVKANQTMIFFSNNKEHQTATGLSKSEEIVLELTKDNPQELHKLFVIFSPDNNFSQPILYSVAENEAQEKIVKSKFELPLHLPSETFQKWLNELRSRNKKVQLHTELLTIRK